VPGRWLVFRYDFERPPPSAATIERLSVSSGVLADLADRGRRHDQPFLIGPDGRPDPRVNAFFASARMLARSALTRSKYAHSIALWLNFLLVSGQRWDAATEEDGEYFKEWRLSDARNPGLVVVEQVAAPRDDVQRGASAWRRDTERLTSCSTPMGLSRIGAVISYGIHWRRDSARPLSRRVWVLELGGFCCICWRRREEPRRTTCRSTVLQGCRGRPAVRTVRRQRGR
jgi:hypothetical protein